jgi:hypothetical protein
MAKFVTRAGALSFRVETDEIDVTMGPHPERDPEWIYVDHKGHAHSMVEGEYPTLRWVEDEPYWCDQHQEEHEQGHWECATCGEEIQPGARIVGGTHREFIPSMRRFYVDDVPVDEDTYNAAFAVAQAAL